MSASSSNTDSAFVKRANRDCRRLDARISALPTDSTAAAYVYDTPILLAGAEKLAAEFEAITPPAAIAKRFGELRGLKAQLITLITLQFRASSSGNHVALADCQFT